jgi:hypothetical protein
VVNVEEVGEVRQSIGGGKGEGEDRRREWNNGQKKIVGRGKGQWGKRGLSRFNLDREKDGDK